MKPKLKPIHDQVVVLFGATSGIGLETALHMVEKGAKVAIVGRNQEGLNDAAERVRSHAQASQMVRNRGNGHTSMPMGGMQSSMGQEMGMGTSTAVAAVEDQVLALEADITNFDQVRSVADQVIQRFGRIDTWVNVAAVSEWALFEDTSAEEFRRIIEVNLIGQAYGAMAALPYLKQQDGGSIIFVSSIAGRVAIPYQSAYNASKHGILGMVDTIRQEVRHTRLPVNVVAILPASINTPLFSKARTKLGVEPHPIPPIYDAKMVAKAITYGATHPVRELIVGDSGYVMNFMRRLAPTLTSNTMGASGFRMQRSNEPKSPQAPDNLYNHMTGYNQVDGEYSPKTKQFSPITWLATHPAARMALIAAVIGGAALFFGMRQRSMHRQRSFGYRVKHQSANIGHDVTSFLAGLPVVSRLPMFRRRTFLQRVGDFFGELGGMMGSRARYGVTRVGEGIGHSASRVGDTIDYGVSHLPFNRKKSTPRLVYERVYDSLPFTHRRRSLVDRLPFVHRKSTPQRVYERVYDSLPFTNQPKPLNERLPLYEQRKAMMERMPSRKDIMERIPSKSDIMDRIPSKNDVKDTFDRTKERVAPSYVKRRETLIAKTPFGERKEIVEEKVPIDKA